MGDMEDYKLRKVVNDYMKEVCHYSQKQIFANSSYQRNYFQLQIDESTTGLINFLQLYYSSDNRRRPYSAQEDQVLIEQYVDNGTVAQNSISENPEMQPGVQSGVQPEIQPIAQQGIQPGVQPETQLDTQPENTTGTGNQREFTAEELCQYNGRNGNPAYVAVNGIVYDVSNVVRWAGGSHFGLVAGQDHTSDFMGCHDGMTERLQGLPVVGIFLPS